MRISHFVPLRGSKINVAKEILSELGIRNDCYLYALRLAGAPYPTIVLSSIPPKIWDRAFKLVIYLSRGPGSLSSAANVISEMGINLFASWAAATTASGEGCWTSVVELPSEYLVDQGINNLKEKIIARLREKGALSESEEFKTGLDRVILIPLKVLQNLRHHVVPECQYVGHVEHYSLDLREFYDSNKFDLFESIIVTEYPNRGIPAPEYCILTPDTEERYIRLTFLPYHSRMVQISMKLQICSEEGIFKGYFGSVLENLTLLGFNIYAADNFMLEKKGPTEKATFVFAVDVSKTALPDDLQEMRIQLHKKLKKSLDKHASMLEKSSVDLFEEDFRLERIETLFTRCFFATNARQQEPTVEYAWKVVQALRGLRLDPVNVDITRTRTVYEDVTGLLRACPILVSLHLPTEKNKLENEPPMDESSGSYAPSEWVVFEEAFMDALNRRVFRLRHKDVRPPAFALGWREFVFDQSNFDNKLDGLIKAIETHKASPEYLKAIRESEEWAKKISPDKLRRNLEGEYPPYPTR